MNINVKLLPPRVGNERNRTMLFSIDTSEPPTVIFLYGVRNVGKTYSLRYVADKIGAIYYDAKENLPTQEDIKRLLSEAEGKPIIIDEFTYIQFANRILGELGPKYLESFMERFLKRVIEHRARVIITSSYSSDHITVLRSLIRYYAKDLKKPVSRIKTVQPYRIYAIPRPFLQVYFYLYENVRWMKGYYFGFAKHALPNDVDLSGFKYSYVRPELYSKFFLRFDLEKLRKALAVYFITGGMPVIKDVKDVDAFGSIYDDDYLHNARDALPMDDMKYIKTEIERIGRVDTDIKNFLMGKGDAPPKEISEVAPLINTYLILPLRSSYSYSDIVEKMPIKNVDALTGKISYVAIDPRVHHALYRSIVSDNPPERPSEYLGAVAESAVGITLLYLLGYTQPKIRNSIRPPIFRVKEKRGRKTLYNPDFIAFPKIDESVSKSLYTTFIVEVKRRKELEAEYVEKYLRPLAYLGFAFGSYPILVMRSKDPFRRIPIKIDEDVPENIRALGLDKEKIMETHLRSFKALYDLPTSPYEIPCTRYVNIMSFEYFLSSAFPQRIEGV